MSSHSPPFDAAALAAGDAARIWVKHLASLLLPVNALAFLFTGPHAWYVAPLFMLPVVAAFVLDDGARVEERQPDEVLPGWPFDALVYVLAGLQIAVVFGIARMFAVQDFFSVDMIVLITVVGGSSGFSIITAHELIHRRKPWERQLGRLLLCTVLQEHFFTEHLRGHHVRVGTPEDPATARFGESYGDFYRRTVPAQFKSAWQLEKQRLEAVPGETGGGAVATLARNRIVQGLVVGWAIAVLVGVTAGLAAFAAFLLQAFFSSRLLEAVNYFEHWGLMRSGSRVRPRDSWDTHSWFTYYGLVGLSRHADHHYEQTRPYQQLRVYEDVPMLPSGYVGMVDMVMTRNEDFQRMATEELRRCGLGPFADGAEPEMPSVPEPSGWLASWRGQPAWLRGGVSASVFLLAVTAGARLFGESTAAMIPGLAWNAWILGAFLVVFRVENRLSARNVNPVLGWSIALGLLVVLGLVSERAVALLA